MESIKKPLLSIVTVTYNCVDSIEDTILSVINQDYPFIEYIIIDGGSKDGTVEIIKKYSDSIAYWVSEPDKGLYDAMNKGIQKATGEWITMRNSGDCFAEKNSLSKLFAEPIPNNVTFVHAECYRVTNWGWRIEKPHDLSQYKSVMPLIHPATFVRTEYHKMHPFDTKYRVSADYNLICNAIQEGCEFIYRPIPIVVFPTGGYSTIHWDVEYWEGLTVSRQLDTKYERFLAWLRYVYLYIIKKVKPVIEAIPLIKRYRDKKQEKKYKMLPLPLEKYY